MASRPPGFHGLFGSRARPSPLTSNQSILSRVDSSEITPEMLKEQEQASHVISRKLDFKFSGGAAELKKIKKIRNKDKKKEKKPVAEKSVPKQVEVKNKNKKKKKKLTEDQKKTLAENKAQLNKMRTLFDYL